LTFERVIVMDCCVYWTKSPKEISKMKLKPNNGTIEIKRSQAEETVVERKPQTTLIRPKIDFKELEFLDLLEGKHVKPPGCYPCSVPFTIQNCKNSQMFIMNRLQQCQVDDCENCFIYIGPTEGSVFIRNCKGCVIVVACHQFRTRDCIDLKLGLHCLQQPTFETSTNVEICPFEYQYAELASQFDFSKPNDSVFYDFSNQDIYLGTKCPLMFP
jgi:hypothetical protein